jgi:hypothetical protein
MPPSICPLLIPNTHSCVVGAYKPHAGKTAHGRLAKASGIDPKWAVGGSIKGDGRVELRSESLNRTNLGKCDATGTQAGVQARWMIYTVQFETNGKRK